MNRLVFIITTILMTGVSAQVIAGDPAVGQVKAQACVACHGADGNSANSGFPSLAVPSHLRFVPTAGCGPAAVPYQSFPTNTPGPKTPEGAPHRCGGGPPAAGRCVPSGQGAFGRDSTVLPGAARSSQGHLPRLLP